MYGGSTYAERPYGAAIDSRVFAYAAARVLVSFEYTIYVASSTFATGPSDVLANKQFRGTLEQYQFTRSLLEGGSEIGVFATGGGSLLINNGDAFYDSLVKSYAVDGRDVVVRTGRLGSNYYGAYYPLARVVASNWVITETGITIDLEDYSYKLRVPAQTNTYGGTGGADGGTDVASKRKPRALGYVSNVLPVLVNAANLVYQVNDGQIQDVTAVYDKAVLITKAADYASYAALVAASLTAGTYGTCKALGLFRLASPPDGQVTADVEGDAAGGVFVYKTADIISRLITTATELTDADLEAQSFTDLNTAQPAPVGYWIGSDDDFEVADVAAALMRGIGGWLGFDRVNGLVKVGRVAAPAGAAVQSFTRSDFIGDSESAFRRDNLPAALYPPPWRWRVPYARIWQQQAGEVADSVTTARKAILNSPYQLSEASDDSIKLDHKRAADPDPVGSYFRDAADAEAEAARRLALWRAEYALYRMRLPQRASHLDLGDLIDVTADRFDLAAGRTMVVLEVRESMIPDDTSVNYVEVVGLG